MYEVDNITTVASITELRADTDTVVEATEESSSEGVLIQRNNEPLAVLVPIRQWRNLLAKDREEETDE
jgi:prevent-host-death family protein